MNRSTIITALAGLVMALTIVATLGGILSQETGDPIGFTTVRGEQVELYGHGLYRYDSLFSGANYRAQDIVVLAVAVPALGAAALSAHRGSRPGRLLLGAAFGALAYVYASMALMAAFNPFFLAYVAILSASLFGLVLTLRAIEQSDLEVLRAARMPWQSGSVFMLVGGAVTLVVWLVPLVSAQLAGNPPDHLYHNTTMVTDALDLAVITPGAVVCGLLLRRHRPLGIALAMPLLGIVVLLLPLIVGGTISQIAAGIEYTPGEVVGPIAGFGLLGVAGAALLVTIVRRAGTRASAASGIEGDHSR